VTGFALVSDGYQNNLSTVFNPIFVSGTCSGANPPADAAQKKLYPKVYTSTVSTRVSNSLLVGEIIGQVVVGLICDYVGRKTAMVGTTVLIVVGGILCTCAKAPSMFPPHATR
jgi:MFS family permease